MIAAFLNRMTMYRLMLYYLVILLVTTLLASQFGYLPYNPIDIFVTSLILYLVCYASNQLFARLFKAKTNFESQFITALILTLIVGPPFSASHLAFLVGVGVIAMASKYVLAYNGSHIFNPAAIAVLITAVVFDRPASWWIGSSVTLPVVVLGGALVLQKIRRWNLAVGFVFAYCALTAAIHYAQGGDVVSWWDGLTTTALVTPLLFFMCVMLIEPLTSPRDYTLRFYFGVFTAVVLVVYQNLLPSLPYTLELALVTGNLFSRFLNSDRRTTLTLTDKKELAPSIWAFWFKPNKPLSFQAGQFLEWTLPHPHPDDRGVRRFFTIASSPTEERVMLVTKMASERPSSFKSALHDLTSGDDISAAHLEGDYVLPQDRTQKCVFIAGGIGITPFHSMVQYLLDTNQKQPITLLYSARSADEFIFTDTFKQAEKAFAMKTVYVVSEHPPKEWKGQSGFIDEKMIQEEVPDYKERLFYVSGPEPMVEAFEKMLGGMGVKKDMIKRDYFPGYTDTHRHK